MFTQLFAFSVLALSCVSAQSSNVTVQDVIQAFTAAKVVPDVVPVFDPIGLLDVVFTDATGATVDVTPGMNLTRNQTALRPQVSFITNMTTSGTQTFVLAMVDPDAPTPQNPNVSQIRHLLAPNIVLNASSAVLANNTPAISDFQRPTPPAGSDPHRYILLLFVQPADFDQTAAGFVNSTTPISNFNISQFAAQTGLGNPVAGNFFLTGPDAANATSTNGTSTSTNDTAGATGTAPADSSSAPSPGVTGGNSALGRTELSVVGIASVLGFLGMFLL